MMIKESDIERHSDAVDHWTAFTGLLITCNTDEADKLKQQILKNQKIVQRVRDCLEEERNELVCTDHEEIQHKAVLSVLEGLLGE